MDKNTWLNTPTLVTGMVYSGCKPTGHPPVPLIGCLAVRARMTISDIDSQVGLHRGMVCFRIPMRRAGTSIRTATLIFVHPTGVLQTTAKIGIIYPVILEMIHTVQYPYCASKSCIRNRPALQTLKFCGLRLF
jgi:hypothetical protein